MARWNRTGSATVTNGQQAVTGTLTAWHVSVRAGDRICFDLNAATQKWYEVASIQSNTALTLGNNFTGASATVTGASGVFAIDNCSPDWSKPGEVSLSISRLLERITLLTQPAGPGDALKLPRVNAAGTAYELVADRVAQFAGGADAYKTLRLNVGGTLAELVPSVNASGGWAPYQTTGTLMPELRFGGASTGITYGARYGNYIRVGSFCAYNATILLSSKGSAAGAASIAALPFTIQDNFGSVAQYYAGMSALSGPLALNQQAGTSTANLVQLTSAGVSDLNNAHFTNGSFFVMVGYCKV